MTATALGAAPRQRAAGGLLMMVLAMAGFTASDTICKYLAADFDALQVSWARYSFNLLPMLVLLRLQGRGTIRRAARSVQPALQLVRALALLVSATIFIFALRLMPLASAMAIAFVAPLLIAILSGPMLGERVGLQRWLAVLTGFGGMLLIAWPGGAGFALAGSLLTLLSASCWALGQVLTRRLSADSPSTTLLYAALLGSAILSLAVPAVWQWPTAGGWLLMACVGIVSGLSHLLLVGAFRRADAATLAPLNYTQLLWAAVAGWLVFGEIPGGRTLAGAAVIVAAGLWVLWQEKRAVVA
jgi:drug/metabolite transporter (DMT)-like permease